jgi:hypothetical protein
MIPSGRMSRVDALAIHLTTGDAYVAGKTYALDFPGTTGGAQSASGGCGFTGPPSALSLSSFARFLRPGGGGIGKPALTDKHQIADIDHRVREVSENANRIPSENKVKAHDYASGNSNTRTTPE